MTALLADLSVFSSSSRSRVVPTELAAAVLRGAVVIDIRPQAIRAVQGTLPGALAIDPSQLAGRLHPDAPTRLARAADQQVEWVLVSSDGAASALAALALSALGLRNVVDVEGGYRALRAKGGIDAVASAQHLRREARAIAAH